MNKKARQTNRFLWMLPIVCVVMLGAFVARSQDVTPGAAVAFDTPFLFAYGSWEKKVQAEGGRALLRGAGVTGKGGGGVNTNFNWGTRADEMSPALRLRVGAGNKVKMLRLLLRDTQERVATYEFLLSTPSAEFMLVTPRDGVPLSKPQATEKGVPDFGALMQWQLTGDWSDEPLDVEVQSIALVAPDVNILIERATLAQKEELTRDTWTPNVWVWDYLAARK